MFLLEKTVQIIHARNVLVSLSDSVVCFYEIEIKGNIFIIENTYFQPHCFFIQLPYSYFVTLILVVFIFH
jgi:hypothetical protein